MNIVSFDNYPHALDYLADKLGARKFDPREYYIVIAPDRYTQTLESRLFGSRGAIDAEVITLSRLARRVASRLRKRRFRKKAG